MAVSRFEQETSLFGRSARNTILVAVWEWAAIIHFLRSWTAKFYLIEAENELTSSPVKSKAPFSKDRGRYVLCSCFRSLYSIIFEIGYSTIPHAPDALSCGINFRTADSSMIVETANH